MTGARPKLHQEAAVLRFPHSVALLHNVLESGAVGTLLTTPEGEVSYANRAAFDVLGYEPDQIVGQPLGRIIRPDSLADVAESMRALLAGEKDTCRAERCFVKKNGEAVWMLLSASVLRNERTGHPLCLIAQLVDIDRQKKAEAALAESESRMNYALEAARQGVWDHRVGTDTVYYSRMWRLMRGFGPDEDVDSTREAWLSRVHPEDRKRIEERIPKQDRGVEGYDILEYRERHRDGHYVWILSRGKPVEWDDAGNPVRTVGTDTDITRQKIAEAQVAEEKERLRVTLESIGDGVISTDGQGRVTFMNPAAETMTGWASQEAIGQRVEDVFDIVNSETGELARNPITECLVREQPFRLEQDVVLVARTGERRDIRDSAAPVRTPEGRIMGAVLVFQDVTQSRALQRQLAHSAMHDSLTGLPNRLAFDRALEACIEQARRELREHALCFVDLDHFKLVNDSAGHAAGDTLLKEIAAVIRRVRRKQDFTARIGGDEFAILLGDCSVVAARRVAQQIVDAIGNVHFSWQGTVHRVGASVGIAPITNRSGGVEQVFGQADAACYAAKASGKNQVAVFEPGHEWPARAKQIA